MVYAKGDKHLGQYKNNKRNGHGKTIFTNGEIYEGEYLNDQRDGFGIMKYINGEVYHGSWKGNMREGKGRLLPSIKDADESFLVNFAETVWKDDQRVNSWPLTCQGPSLNDICRMQ
jgi:hypothetical protein